MTTGTVNTLAATLLAAQAIVVGILLSGTDPVLLPVTADFGGGIQLTSVNLGVAAVTLLVFSALCRAIDAVRPSPVIRWIEWSQVSGIVVFLVAQINGVTDVAALVALYAITAGSSLFLVLHERAVESTWPFSFGAAVAIVPWGVIAFYQVGAIVVGGDPPLLVRVLTIALLLLASAYWYDARLARVKGRPIIAERAHTILTTLTVSVLAWAVVVGSQVVVYTAL
ncbi:MAG: hypothetical protein LCH43_11585 [Actinobacteria bacterium]|nr:hypothetical protein [Actinomycetota bacterium]